MTKPSPPNIEGGSQTLARGLNALTLIGETESRLTVTELADRLDIHRSMAYRLVKTLEQYGFVERLPSGKLELGTRLAALARGVAKSLQDAAAPELADVADQLSMTTFLVVYDGTSAVTLNSVEPQHAETTVAQRPGSRHSIDKGAPGRVIRSMLDPERYPPEPYELSHAEVLPGLTSIAIPLHLPQDRLAAIAVLYLPGEIGKEEVVAVLGAAARRISAAMQ